MDDLKASQRALGERAIPGLLLSFSLPAIVGMTAQSLYNMVDSIFIGHSVGPLGLAGLAICFPLQNLSAAFGAMVGVGAGTLISVKLGGRDVKGAERTAGMVVQLNVVIGLAFMALALVFLDPLLLFFGGSQETLPYAREYMSVLLLGNIVTHLYLGLNDVLRSSGYPRRAMTATLTAVGINVVLDYLLIMVAGLGIRGAALATVVAQVIALVVVIVHLRQKDAVLHFGREVLTHWRAKIAREIVAIGSAPFLTNACACLVVLLINQGLRDHGGDLHISAYGICNRVCFIFVMVTQGICQGMQPIAGFNYGAGQLGRSRQVYRLAVAMGVGVFSVGMLVAEVFPDFVIGWFTDDEALLGIARRGLRIMFCAAPMVAFGIVSGGLLLALKRPREAIIMSVCRQMVILVPLLLLLPPRLGPDGVWMSMPIADTVAAFIAVYFVLKITRESLVVSR